MQDHGGVVDDAADAPLPRVAVTALLDRPQAPGPRRRHRTVPARTPADRPAPRADAPHPASPPDAVVPRRRAVRPHLLVPVAALLVLAAGTTAPGTIAPATQEPPTEHRAVLPYAQVPLFQDGVTVRADGGVRALPTGLQRVFLPGSRVVDPAASVLGTALVGAAAWDDGAANAPRAAEQAAAQRAWLDAGTVPGAGGPYEDMARTALLDLRTLDVGRGALVAGWSTRWRYVWPRDASFAAVALARTGHVDDALDILAFLEDQQAEDGSFQARYRPDGSGPPDRRGIQTDGTGWAMWAAGQVLAETGTSTRASAAERVRALVERSVHRALDLTSATGLPPASPDFWEVKERELTLGTAAPLVAGLEQAAWVLRVLGDDALAELAQAGAARSRTAVVREFGPGGYARHAWDPHRDAATAFLLPPFQRTALPDAEDAWRASAPTMLRAASGLAPGAGWRDDGVSWTPQTSLYAWVAAEQGDTALATGWLDFLDAHRTAAGSIPEKVLADGSPAAVAPLAWSAACTLLALDALDRLDAAS